MNIKINKNFKNVKIGDKRAYNTTVIYYSDIPVLGRLIHEKYLISLIMGM